MYAALRRGLQAAAVDSTGRLRSPEAMEALQAKMMKRPADFSKF